MSDILPWSIIGVFLLKEVISALIKDKFKKSDEFASLVNENTKEVIKLRAELNFINQTVQDVPKIKQDLNEAHAKIRELKASLSVQNS